MFTQPCFIRKNTSLLIKRLEEIGYSKNSPYWTDKCSIVWCYQYSKEKGFDTPHYVIADSFDIPFDKHSSLCGRFIDCGTNEDLFLALAALRDDEGYMQFFTDGKDFILCDRQDWIDMYSTLCSGGKYTMDQLDLFHKATAKELIQHFNNI